MSKENSRFMECIGYLLKNGIVKSNREVASAIDVSPSTLTDISHGRIQVNPKTLRKLSELYGFKFTYLTGTTDIFMVEEPKVEYRTIDESITLPAEAYQAMIYKIKDLEKKLNDCLDVSRKQTSTV